MKSQDRMRVAADDPRLSWNGAVSLRKTADGVQPWRVPVAELGLFPEAMHLAASKSTGVRVGFRTDSRSVGMEFRTKWDDVPEPGKIDLTCDGQVAGSQPVSDRESLVFEGLPAGDKAVEIWLPMRTRFCMRGLHLDAGASLGELDDPRPRWLVHGSSITQSSQADSPVGTWPAIVARTRGLNHTNLGFGGQCHLDVMVARMIRSLPADLISLCFGANIMGSASLGPRAFGPGIVGFVKIVREGHPDIPITVMSPIWSLESERTPNAVGFTIPMMRQAVEQAVEILRGHGDRNVHYVNGLDILGAEQENRLPDRLHPDAEGYRIMARNFLEKVISRVYPGQMPEQASFSHKDTT